MKPAGAKTPVQTSRFSRTSNAAMNMSPLGLPGRTFTTGSRPVDRKHEGHRSLHVGDLDGLLVGVVSRAGTGPPVELFNPESFHDSIVPPDSVQSQPPARWYFR